MPIRFLNVGLERGLRQLVKAAAPYHVIHTTVETQLMTLGLKRLQQRHEGEPNRPRKGGLDDETGPTGLLDEMDGFPVRQLGLGAGHAAAEPLYQVGGTAHVHEERVRHSEVPAYIADLGKAIGDADTMID